MPEELPGNYQRAKYDAEKDLDPDYRLTCSFIHRDHRRQAVARAALRGALDLVAQAGGGEGRGLPARCDTRGEKMTASHLYNVTPAVIEEAGL